LKKTVKVFDNGDREWYLNDLRHREDGPAVEYPDGDRYWYLNDIEYTEKEFNEKPKQSSKI
jgi:hypothetical protein